MYKKSSNQQSKTNEVAFIVQSRIYQSYFCVKISSMVTNTLMHLFIISSRQNWRHRGGCDLGGACDHIKGLLLYPIPHIKAMPVLNACWVDMPYAHVCLGEHGLNQDILCSCCSELVSMVTPAKLSVCRCEHPLSVPIATEADWQWATFRVCRHGRSARPENRST